MNNCFENDVLGISKTVSWCCCHGNIVCFIAFLISICRKQMSIIKTLKVMLIYTFAVKKYQTSNMLFLCTVADRLAFGLPW